VLLPAVGGVTALTGETGAAGEERTARLRVGTFDSLGVKMIKEIIATPPVDESELSHDH
jgi:hypothetical protein